MKLLICYRISISAIDWAKLDHFFGSPKSPGSNLKVFENIFESFESLQIVWKYHLTLELVISTKKERKRNIYKSSDRAAPIGPWYITNVLRSRRRENLLSKTSKEGNVQHFPILTFALQKGQRGGGQIPFQISKTN